MSISINGMSSVTPSSSGPDPSKMAGRMMKDMDTNQDGKVTKDEFVAVLKEKGFSEDDAGSQFDAVDTQKTGEITQTDIESAIRGGKIGPARSGGNPPPAGAGGPPPAGGGPGGAGAAGKSSESQSDNTTKTYDPADTNKDGTVSAQELIAYELSQATKDAVTQTTASNTGNNVDEFV